MQDEKVVFYSGLLNNATVSTAVRLPLVEGGCSSWLLT